MDADQKGVLTREECDAVDFGSDPAKIDFDKLHENRLALLHKAYERSNIAQDGGFHAFCADNAWWMSRMWYSFKLYDVVRIDHFRGFDEYFSIPADAATARAGHWEKGPGMNQPGTVGFNWRWRLAPGQVTDALADELLALTKRTGRVNWDILNG